MAPVPLEGHQTPISNNIVQEGSRGGSISLGMLIDFIVERTYHELTVLAEFILWHFDKQSMLFVETADMPARMSRETSVNARLPNFHIPAAVEVLTTGTYKKLSSCIRDKIVPPDPITQSEKRSTLQRLNQVIQHRLVTLRSGNLLPQMRNEEAGRATFHVDHEFGVSLTVMGDCPNIPWRLLNIEIEDKETGDGKALVYPLQVNYFHQVLQISLQDHPNPLHEAYSYLHYFCQSLHLEVVASSPVGVMMGAGPMQSPASMMHSPIPGQYSVMGGPPPPGPHPIIGGPQ